MTQHIKIEGPMGSGKTTIARAIMSALDTLNKGAVRIENPKEYRIYVPYGKEEIIPDVVIWDGCEPPEDIQMSKTISIEVHDV